jgi:hypothetical protein
MTLAGAPTNAQGVPIGKMLPQTLTATLSNNTAAMVAAKYTVDKLKLYAGYEWMQYAPPSDPFTVKGTGFTNIAGDFICFGCNTATDGTNINSTAYSGSAGFKDKILQLGLGRRQILSYRQPGRGWRVLSLLAEHLRCQRRQHNCLHRLGGQ